MIAIDDRRRTRSDAGAQIGKTCCVTVGPDLAATAQVIGNDTFIHAALFLRDCQPPGDSKTCKAGANIEAPMATRLQQVRGLCRPAFAGRTLVGPGVIVWLW